MRGPEATTTLTDTDPELVTRRHRVAESGARSSTEGWQNRRLILGKATTS